MTMTMHMNQLNQSLAVLETWQQQSVEQRVAIVQRWATLLDQRDNKFTESVAMIRFQCQQALATIAQTHTLQGPTGETNQLYCVGRGSFLVFADEAANTTALVGLISAALVAGNTVICSAANTHIELDSLLSELLRAGCPDRVATQVLAEACEPLAKQPQLAGVALAAAPETCQRFNQILAERDGQLAQLIYETDSLNFSQLSDSKLCLRFITERTRTINITAVGGNASLLELGSGE
ncbi:hypothetical protein [Agarivorans sp. DSG3-1]|uniref:hypothetical protein n=1 Tax=Agarivorans sp. DSG3-1 TaxID=3342249 RepID=UPI00398F3763